MSRFDNDGAKQTIGAAVLIGFAALFFLFLTGVGPKLLAGHKRTVEAAFTSVGGLNIGEPVRINGLTVGKVTEISRNPGAAGTMVKMEISGDSGDLYRDAGAGIRWRTALGSAFVVNLVRGTKGSGSLGNQIIPASRTTSQVELDEITSALRTGARRGIKQTLHELPKALANPAEPGEPMAVLGREGKTIAVGLDALLGRRRDRDLSNLVRYTGNTVRALDAPQDQLRSLVQNAGLTLHVTAERAGDLQSMIGTLSRIQPRSRATLKAADTTLAVAERVVRKLEKPAGDLAPTLATLRPVVVSADSLLREKVRPVLTSLRPAADSLAAASRNGLPLLRSLIPVLKNLDEKVLPDLEQVSPDTKHPTYEMIGPAISGLTGATGNFDNEASYVRLHGSAGGSAFDTLPCQASIGNTNSPFVSCTNFNDLLKRYLNLPGGR